MERATAQKFVVFSKYDFVKNYIEASDAETKAALIADGIKTVENNVVTKPDLENSVLKLDSKIDASVERLDQKIDASVESLDQKIDSVKSDIKSDINANHTAVMKEINSHFKWMFGIMLLLLISYMKPVFFS